jgi:hypothetical protein
MILDQYGSAAQVSKFASGANRSTLRTPQWQNWDNAIDKLIPSNDRKTLVVLSKRLFTNFGVLKAIVTQKADYSVGDAWLPNYEGRDKEAGDEVEGWLNNVWFPNCEVRGGVWDWRNVLSMVSHDIDFGDSYTLLTTTADGTFPLIQPISSWRVDSCNDQETVSSGRYKGEKINDGHIYNRSGRVIAYRVRSANDPSKYDDIPANSIIHAFDPDFEDQGRGFPSSTHALEDLKHCLQSTEYERIRQMIISSIGLIEHNETGGPDFDDPAFALSDPGAGGSGVGYEEIRGGTIRYFKANSGAKLEQIKHDSPGDMWENFHDRLLRNAVIGASWSYAMVWKPTGQGTAERADVLRARRAIAKRQRILNMWARRVVSYAYSIAEQNGKVPTLDRPTAWSFTKPPQLTVDDGREQRSIIEAWRAGLLNRTQAVEAMGRTIEEHEDERARETYLRKLRAREWSRDGITVEDREMAMITPNEMPEEQAQVIEDESTTN